MLNVEQRTTNFEVFLAQMEMESPELKKVIFLGIKKRLKEALFMV
jgi:hypothetical protein